MAKFRPCYAVRDDVDALFQEVVLVLGGVFAVLQTDDETIWRVARGLTCVYGRIHQRRAKAAGRDAALSPHPAIAMLLSLTEREDREAGRAQP